MTLATLTAVALIAALGLASALLLAIRARRVRDRAGHCPHCGALLPNLSAPRCPACGEST